MRKINLTLDNVFRNPFRWGRCPMSLSKERVYGIYVSWGEMMPTSLTNRWVVVLYFYKWYWGISNFRDKSKE